MHGTLPRPAGPDRRGVGAPLVLRLALRQLRGGLSGFGVFLGCIALGVMTIAAVSGLARALTEGLGREGRRILGGDASFSLVQREASSTERSALDARGRVSSVASMRAMAVAPGGDSALVEVKAVDGAYPLVGTVASDPSAPIADLLAPRADAAGGGTTYGAVADPALLVRLGLKVGDVVGLGAARVAIRAKLVAEPDKIAGGIGFGPRLLVSEAGLRATGLLQPGSLVRWTYRLALPEPSSEAALAEAAAEVARALPDAGFEVRTRLNAEPRFVRSIERFTQFLTLVGLTALLVGGIGVANAVRAFVERQRATIATLKSLGATGSTVVAIHLAQVLAIALVGTAVGLAAGAAVPFALDALFAEVLPLPLEPRVVPADLGLGLLYGLLTALAFSIAPLGRAHDVGVSGLFRDAVDPERRRPRARYLAVLALALAALVGLAVLAAFDRWVAILFVAAAALTFGLLRLVAAGLMRLAARLPRPRRAAARLALANLHRPGALTPSVVLSLGLGITLLVALGGVDTNLRREITRTLPANAPSLFFLDVPSAQAGPFEDHLRAAAPGGKVERVPIMRGRITALKGRPVSEIKAAENVAWVLDGDRGLTYAQTLPEGSTIEAGAWWPADYAGRPLVSFDREIAAGLGLQVGDEVTINVLGRALTATIANLRKVEWRTLGINFVMVFSPNSFAGAPHSDLATLTLTGGPNPEREAAILRDVARAFPSVTSVRVKEALDAVSDLVSKLVLAIRGASGIALAASLLVLAGALAAGHRARLYDAVILKTLGATRARLVGAYALEYGALGLATALFGIAAGTAAAWAIVSRVMHLGFTPDVPGAVAAAAAAVVATIGFGLLGTWRILGQKPAAYLRDL